MEHSDNASETAPVGEGGSPKHMDRRNFLRSLVGGVAAATAVRTWPFRVYSFPTEVVRVPVFDQINAISLKAFLDKNIDDWFFKDTPFLEALRRKQIQRCIIGGPLAAVNV